MRKLTITIELDRLAKYAPGTTPAEVIEQQLEHIGPTGITGGGREAVVWTHNSANVGKITYKE